MTSSSPFECIDLNHAINRLSAYRLHWWRGRDGHRDGDVAKIGARLVGDDLAPGQTVVIVVVALRAREHRRGSPRRRAVVTSRSGDRKLLERRRGINTIALLPVERAEHCEASE